MEERRWDELNRDCLVEILSRVGMNSLMDYTPFVCKSWYNATLDPKCWKCLVIPPLRGRYSIRFLEFLVGRSQGSATSIEFLGYYPDQALVYISENCPELQFLSLTFGYSSSIIHHFIIKWKNLMHLHLHFPCVELALILELISIHCKNFVGLLCYYTIFWEERISAIVNFIPKIKYLRLLDCYIPREGLVMILNRCRDLEVLDVSLSKGINDNDAELRKLASHIKSFYCTGCFKAPL